MRDGDVVLRFGGVDIVDLNHLINSVSMAPVGEAAEVVVWRDRREVAMRVTVGDRERTLSRPEPASPADSARDPPDLVRRPDRPDHSFDLSSLAWSSQRSMPNLPSGSNCPKAGAAHSS